MRLPNEYPYATEIENINAFARSPLAPFMHFGGAFGWKKWDQTHNNRQQLAQIQIHGTVTISDVPGWPLIIETPVTVEGEGIIAKDPIFHGYRHSIFDEHIIEIPLTKGHDIIYVDRNITPYYIEIGFVPLIGSAYDIKMSRNSLIINLQTEQDFFQN